MTQQARPPRIAEATAEALRRGDPRAFEELYVQLRGDVYNLAARIVGDRGEAEDIAQEVFLRAYRHLPGKAEQLRPDSWVFRTTVNACYDHLRRRKPAPVEPVAGREPAAGDAFEQAATAAAVEEALGRLNPRYRTALVLKDLHGLGNGEIAEVMGIARGTVGVLLFRARGAFEKRYREVAPTLGAGLPAAGLAIWLPPLVVPDSLMSTPAFLTPLTVAPTAAPTAVAPMAPLAAAATPVAAGLAKIAGALGTKVAVVAIAATAATGGGIALHEARDATHSPKSPTAAATTVHHDAGSEDGSAQHSRTHAALTAGSMDHAGDGTGTHAGDATGGDGAGTHAGDGSGGTDGDGTGTHAGETSGDGAAGDSHTGSGSGSTGGEGTHTGDGTGGDGTHAGDGAPSGDGTAADGAHSGGDAGTREGSGTTHGEAVPAA